MTKLIFILLTVNFLTSCSFLDSVDHNVPMNSAIIYGVAKSTTILAFESIYEDLEERMEAAGELLVTIDTYILPILSNPQATINAEAEQMLFDQIPEEYWFYLEVALESLNHYYVSPIENQVMSNEYVQYLRSFFSGLRQAASDMLNENNKIIDIKTTVKNIETTLSY